MQSIIIPNPFFSISQSNRNYLKFFYLEVNIAETFHVIIIKYTHSLEFCIKINHR
jgi:hypothetical protein